MVRGEGIELVYLFMLLVVMNMEQRGKQLQVIAYDNACKLLAKIWAKKDACRPWIENMHRIVIVLDNFHKDSGG